MVPLFLPLLSFIAGILASSHLDPASVWFCLPLAVGLGFLRRPCALIAVFLSGAGLRSLEPPVPPTPGPEPVRLVGVLRKAPEWRGLGVYLDIDLLSVDQKPYRGRARLTEFLNDTEMSGRFNALDLGSGDRVQILVKLQRPMAYRNPGAFDFRRFLERDGIYWTGNIRNPRLIEVQSRGWHGPDHVLAWTRNQLGRYFESDRAAGGLIKGMVLGQKYELTAAVERQFQASGLYHLVVVSGFNLAVVAAAAGVASRYLSRKRRTRLILVIVCSLAYAAIAQGGAPVTRATIMAVVLIVGKLLDRGYSALNATAASAFLILLWAPTSLEESSFQMTFAAVLAVVIIGSPAARWAFNGLNTALGNFGDVSKDGHLSPAIADWRVSRRLWCELHNVPYWCITVPWRFLQYSGEALIIAVSVEGIMAYFMIESFHRLAPLSPFLNVPAGLIAAIVTPLGLLMIFLPAVLAAPLGWMLSKLVQVLLSLPVVSIRVPSAPVWVWCAYGVAVGVLVWTIATRRARPCCVAAIGIMLFQYLIAGADFSPIPPKDTRLTFLDVGQGDSVLAEFPDGRRMLVDGGGVAAGRFLGLRDESTFSIGEDVVSQYLFSRRIRRLDVVVLTHAHNDHLDGLFEVVENFEVGEVWLGRNPLIPPYRDFLHKLSSLGIPIRWIAAGQTVNGVEILHPPANWRVRKTAQNNDSVVLLLRWGQQTALLTGDLETALSSAPERVSILKVPHHGSRNTRLRVQADVPVISVGANNPFGHPDPSKLPALRTDMLGAIAVEMSGDRPKIDLAGVENLGPPPSVH